MAELSLKQALSKINAVEKAILGAKGRVEVSILQRRLANMNLRIFVRGIATDGQLITSKVLAKNPRIGAYSQRQGIARQNTGRQVGVVDLNKTSELRSRLITGRDGKKYILGFSTLKARRIALSHEEYRRKEIWRGTNNERKQDNKVAIAEVRALIRQSLR